MCPRECREPLKPGVIRPHPTRADLAVHSLECATAAPWETRTQWLDRCHARRRQTQSAARPSPHRKEAQSRARLGSHANDFRRRRCVGPVGSPFCPPSIPSALFDPDLENCRAQTKNAFSFHPPSPRVRAVCVRTGPRVVAPAGVFLIPCHADRLVIPLKPMDSKMALLRHLFLFPNALSDVLGTLNTQKQSIGRRSRARWTGPARVRNVNLSERINPKDNKVKGDVL